MEYTLTTAEAATLKAFTDQANATQREIASVENRLTQLRADLNAQQGAFKGAVQLIVKQQGIEAEPKRNPWKEPSVYRYVPMRAYSAFLPSPTY